MQTSLLGDELAALEVRAARVRGLEEVSARLQRRLIAADAQRRQAVDDHGACLERALATNAAHAERLQRQAEQHGQELSEKDKHIYALEHQVKIIF